MAVLIWLIPLIPLVGFLLETVFGRRMPVSLSGAIGASTVGAAAVVALVVALPYSFAQPTDTVLSASLGTWVAIPGLEVSFGLRVDGLSALMIMVIGVVGFIIHLYSTSFMKGKGDYHRFFAYMNLFVGSMFLLVLADNLLLLFVGWEGVGLCSYLLIGFWYGERENDRAAQKAFLVTRLADIAFLIGIFLVLLNAKTLNISQAMSRLTAPGADRAVAVAAAVLILIGAMGKSAQLPLHLWLPDAMAGPTPVSALIHAATMVTAGVYLIARTYSLFIVSPGVQLAVAIIGAATLFYSGLSALVQIDIKRILAYSTISQIGYMFLGLGAGAWAGSMFHFMTHAMFKALLFLSAGVIIHLLDEEHSIFRMGGLRKSNPLLFWVFLIGASSLAGIPLVTSGFYSKEAILQTVWESGPAGPALWVVGALGVYLTAAYIFRGFFHAFLGEPRRRPEGKVGPMMYAPLVILALFSVAAGFLETPRDLGHVQEISDLLIRDFPAQAIAATQSRTGIGYQVLLQAVAVLLAFLGVLTGYLSYRRARSFSGDRSEADYGMGKRFLFYGMGFDWIMRNAFVTPFLGFARLLQRDWISAFYDAFARLNVWFHRLFSRTQTGLMRWYLFGLSVGLLLMAALVVFV